jgi:hypothetical protein
MKFVSLIFSLVFLVSCQTTRPGITLQDTPLNMSESRKVIQTIIGKPREISENGRELISGYQDSFGQDFEPGKSVERYTIHVLILGDRRPYNIRIEVPVERKTSSGYKRVGYDNTRAKEVAEKIKKALHESRDNRNVIDDFKPF